MIAPNTKKIYNVGMEYLLEYLKKNPKIEAASEGKVVLEHFIGNVISFNDTIITSRISSDKREYKPQINSMVELIIHTPKGVYSAECEVLNELDDGFEFSFPTTVRLSQRREFLRVDYKEPIKVKFNDEGGEKEFETTIENICAGGVAFNSKYKVQDESDIFVEFQINGKDIKSKGKVTYSVPVKGENDIYKTGIIMTSLNPDETLYIIDFCSDFIGKA